MMSNEERLVYMANQIAQNFATMGEEAAVVATADHIAHFWDPRMRARILAHAPGALALSPIAAQAFDLLREQAGARAG
jgi:formate dehydrogenase subunit delta